MTLEAQKQGGNMEAKLIFDLTTEKEDFELALKGVDYHNCLWQMDQHLRSELKYNDLSDYQYAVISQIREKLHEIMRDNKVEL